MNGGDPRGRQTSIDITVMSCGVNCSVILEMSFRAKRSKPTEVQVCPIELACTKHHRTSL